MERFRTIAEALISDHPISLVTLLAEWPETRLGRSVNVSAIKATPRQQAEAVRGRLAAAL